MKKLNRQPKQAIGCKFKEQKKKKEEEPEVSEEEAAAGLGALFG